MEENKAITEMSMVITRASRKKSDGTMRLRLVNSDTGEDVFGEKMSLELFDDFVRRSDANLPVPEPFDKVIHEAKWAGGKPYLSIAHYKSSAFDEFPGEQEKLYRDGNKLKSVDVLYPNKLGNAVWKAVYNDLYEEEKDFDNPIRVSIGFLDLAHKHVIEDGIETYFERKSLEDKCELCAEGVGGKVYLKGHLVHKAFTRVPAHPRTDVEIEMKSAIQTKEQDAKSIIGDDIEIQEKSALKDDLMVVKSEERPEQEEDSPQPVSDDAKGEVLDTQPSEVNMENEITEQDKVVEVSTETPVDEVDEKKDETVIEQSEISKGANAIEAKLAELAEKGIFGQEALAQVQPLFDAMGEVVKAKAAPKGELANIDAVVKSAVSEVVPEIVSQVVSQLSQYVKAPEAVAAPEKSTIPAPRSLTVEKSVTPAGQRQLTQIERLTGGRLS